MKLVVGRRCVFSYNDDNVVLTGISCMIYITCPKIGDGVLTSLQPGLIYISLCLQCHFFILDRLNLSVTIFQITIEQSKCCIFFFDGILMVFLHFFCKLLPNMREHHITALPPKFFCIWLLTGKQQVIHSFLIDVQI